MVCTKAERRSHRLHAADVAGFNVETQIVGVLTRMPKVKSWAKYADQSVVARCRKAHKVPDWDTISTSERLDRGFNIDFPVAFMGYNFGIDVTTSTQPLTLRNKVNKLRKIPTELHPDGVDKVAVWVVTTLPTPERITEVLKHMKSQPRFCEVYHL